MNKQHSSKELNNELLNGRWVDELIELANFLSKGGIISQYPADLSTPYSRKFEDR